MDGFEKSFEKKFADFQSQSLVCKTPWCYHRQEWVGMGIP